MLRVLQSQSQIDEARLWLRTAGCDSSQGWARLRFWLHYTLRYRTAPVPVAVNKSWDVKTMLQAIETHCPNRESAIFEMGCVNSEIPLALWWRGYRNIRASDLDPHGQAIRWYGNEINFYQENFYSPQVPDESFDVMTALSVIEHGYNQTNLLKTFRRFLKPGGMVCLTTDFHEPKLEVPSDFRVFGQTYRIFDRAEIESLIQEAASLGLRLAGDVQWQQSNYPISWLDRNFTFLFLAFIKT
jgi:hypothetical protein